MVRRSTALLIMLFVFTLSIFAQDAYQKAPIISITGNEQIEGTVGNTVHKSVPYPSVITDIGTFTFVNTGILTDYDLQSNGTPNEIWRDPVDPENVHITFMRRDLAATPPVARGNVYLYSDDGGTTWNDFGFVPASPSAGFGCITGTTSGAAVIANHNNTPATPPLATRTMVYVDGGVGLGSFTAYDPVLTPDATGAIWPRTTVSGNNLAIVSSVSGGTGFWINSMNLTTGSFSGWASYPTGDQAETYALASASNGNVGLIYVADDSLNSRDVYFAESTDGGATYGTPVKLYDWDAAGDSLGGLRGVSLVYIDNTPHVAFEVGKVTNDGSYFPNAPSKIMYWSPNVNGGVAKVLADTNNVPYNVNAVNTSAAAVFLPICRPSIGVTTDGRGIFVTFVAASSVMSSDQISYYDGWLTASVDGGNTWMAPEVITPSSPRRDWRFLNISPKNPVDGNTAHLSMVIQSRDTAGISIQGGPAGGTTEAVYIGGEFPHLPSSVGDGMTVNSFTLDQNYPNPFNPSTSISFTLAERSNVTLKVMDILGREVATLLNGEKEAGKHNITFDASNLSTGMYIYTLQAGSFSVSKKMLLMK